MKTRILFALLVLCLGQKAGARCRVGAHPEYDRKIREYTTEPFFSTELVDHLPSSSCVASPDAALGHIVGAPDVLTHVQQINDYMRRLAEKSPRVKVLAMGKSEEGREMLLVVISDAANLARLDQYRSITARLADPRGLSDGEAKQLIERGKPIYWATGSIHSPETASPEMLMELAYRLAVEETPLIEKIRKDAIVLVTPVVEVDGRDRMVDIYLWKKKHSDGPLYPLAWWGHYVAHDNNRDGMTLSLALSRHVMRTFLDWHPQVVHDLHESVPYLYISTGTGPYNAWLDPIVISEWQEMAHHEIEEMTRRGVIGVWTHGFYDGWAPNYMFYVANGHNSIGRFYETFGNGGADTRVRTLQPSSTSRQWYRPNPPLPKVRWSLRNTVNLSESALLLGMHNVASNGRRFLENFYQKSKRSIDKAGREGPAAWVFAADDPRPVEQARLLNLLRLQGAEVHRAAQSFTIKLPPKEPEAGAEGDAGKAPADKTPKEMTFATGSYVVRMDQPYSRMADMMLDTQYYSAKDPRSYDDTGWTLGALRNVQAVRVIDASVLGVRMNKVNGEVRAPGSVEGAGDAYVIDHNADNTLATLRFRLADVKIEAAEAPFELGGRKFHAGSFILRSIDRQRLTREADALGLRVHAVNRPVPVPSHPVAVPRVAIMHTWSATQNDGWFRIAFDELHVPYTYVADTKVREMARLREQFDVIILPPYGGGSLNALVRGLPMRGAPLPWKNTAETPNLVAPGLDSADDIRGGLGYTGLAHLERFVSDGGLLIAVASSAALPPQLGMTELVSTVEPKTLQAPGSVLLAKFDDKKSPIAYGYGDQIYVYYRQGPIVRVSTGLQPEEPEESAAGRASGRGTSSDPDVIQARPYRDEKPPKRTPAEKELYVPEDAEEQARRNLPPRQHWPRVVLRFAKEKELLLSGMVVGGSELAEKPAVVDAPHGKGHVVLLANNPMWRNETMGSFFLIFNAMLHFDHLDAGRAVPAPARPNTTASAAEVQP